MSDVEQPELAYRRVLALTAALFLSYLTVAMSLPAVPVHVVHGLGLDNAYGGLAVGITFVSTILTRGWAGATRTSPDTTSPPAKSTKRRCAKRNEYAAARRLLLTLPISPPITSECGDPTIGAGKAENHQIGMKLLQCSALLARLSGLGLQPGREFVGKRIKLARSFRYRERRLYRTRAQILRDRVARQTGAPADLADRLLLSQRHAPDDV